jgi:hypothetical protein
LGLIKRVVLTRGRVEFFFAVIWLSLGYGWLLEYVACTVVERFGYEQFLEAKKLTRRGGRAGEKKDTDVDSVCGKSTINYE